MKSVECLARLESVGNLVARLLHAYCTLVPTGIILAHLASLAETGTETGS